MIPTLTTDRLTLRPQTMADFAPFAAFMASPRSAYMGGPRDGSQAWDWFASDQAQWSLMGWGGLTVTETATARIIGQVSVIQPPRFPETEIGWIAYEGCEGRGFLTEATRALLGWAFGPRRLKTLVSYVNRANDRSIRMAVRLGAILDPDAATPNAIDSFVYRHAPVGHA
jgi:RimJ/RimL family protein N-acetyltransferase